MVLVTGGTGFVGAYIIKELVSKGYSVRAIRRASALPAFIDAGILSKVEWVEGDILDVLSLEDAMKGIGQVIHAAGIVSFKGGDKERLFHTNIEGTANVVNAALQANITKLVHISSSSALGRKNAAGEVDEDQKWEESRSNTPYAISKYQAELEVWRGMAEGLNAVILNPTTVLGYGNWHNSSCSLFRQVFNEFPYYTTGVNGFVDVQDTARAAVLLMESSISNERFIINGDNWSFQRLLHCIADGLGKKRPTREVTPFLAGLAWRMEKIGGWFGREVRITRQNSRVALSKTKYSNQKILEALPEFRFTPLEESIARACAQYLRHLRY